MTGLAEDGALMAAARRRGADAVAAGEVSLLSCVAVQGFEPQGTGRMLLAIEQGNTNTLFAVHDGETWIAQWRTATESNRTADEYAVWLNQLLEIHARPVDASWTAASSPAWCRSRSSTCATWRGAI